MRIQLAILVAALAAAPSTARADRYGRGLTLFQERSCVRCHSVGWKDSSDVSRRSSTDLTQVTKSHSDDDLRRFLADPRSVKADSACDHRKLTKTQVDDLLHFLHARAKPMPPPPPAPEPARPAPTRNRR